MSQAMGPFRNPLNRTLARATLKRCAHVFARGSITASHLASLPLEAGRHSVAGDLAFLYRDADSLSREGETEVAALLESLAKVRAGASRVTGISPSSVVYEKARRRRFDYIGLLATLVQRALADGDHVVVLPNATRQGSNSTRNNDLPVIELLRLHCEASLPPAEFRRVHWFESDVNTRGIRAIIAGTDILVTSRFHAMIAALSVGTPPLVIGWSHKYDEVLQPFGPAAASFDIGSLDAASMLRRFEEMRRDARRDGRHAGDALAGMERSSERQLAFISAMIDGARSSVDGR
jgi:colanic acid/amylovoran biosynthesis protein